MRTVKSVRKSCDNLWSKIVRAMGRCEKCGRIPGEGEINRLEAHHVYGRRNLRLRWDVKNGVSLCHPCHRWAEEYPIEFTDWFRNYRITDADYLEVVNARGPLVGNEKRILDDYLVLEEELKAELERQP